jgi:hypothetical protein
MGDKLKQEPGTSTTSSQDVSLSPSLSLAKAIPVASSIEVRPTDCRGRPLPSSLQCYESGPLVFCSPEAPAFLDQGRVTAYYRGKESDRNRLADDRRGHHVLEMEGRTKVHSQRRVIYIKISAFDVQPCQVAFVLRILKTD